MATHVQAKPILFANDPRLMRYWLEGKKQGKVDVFANLPGFSDNVRVNLKGQYWMAVDCCRTPTQEILSHNPWLLTLYFKLPFRMKSLRSMTGGAPGDRDLDRTPTWAVASVCIVIILISIALEQALHRLGHWFTKKRMKAMFEALEKVKTELMILGFISLLLTFGQAYISKICIPTNYADSMLPCGSVNFTVEEGKTSHHPSCESGKIPFISAKGIHHLHIFIFFLAMFHVINSAMVMTLARAKINRWKGWETQALKYKFSNDSSGTRHAFVKQHTGFGDKNSIILYIMSFFRQFYRSIGKDDYLTMREGFIAAHLVPGSKFDFQRYIQRSMEDDFKVVVSISSMLWISVVILMLLNVKEWEMMFWASFIPLTIALAVGTKLQVIITRMALQIKDRNIVFKGVPHVTLTDDYFWFHHPCFILSLIHFTLFQNAFQLVYFFWIWYSFGLRSCFHGNTKHTISRVFFGVSVQVLCSYVILPLYALVSQMGIHIKRSIFDEQTTESLKKWQENAVKHCVKQL
ncbi:MLO-like protein [Zostera marina]|uniref:MLO-like protein n=1 Tax=Zostera marina TaxID=29655 RepID=A0A0K9PQ28_ZOSMR|nr:MLO-like protein [Zostera marina]